MSLTDDAREAKRLGLSYGQYMNRKFVASRANVGGMRCLECGKLLYGRQRNYCSAACGRKRTTKRRQAGEFV